MKQRHMLNVELYQGVILLEAQIFFYFFFKAQTQQMWSYIYALGAAQHHHLVVKMLIVFILLKLEAKPSCWFLFISRVCFFFYFLPWTF